MEMNGKAKNDTGHAEVGKVLNLVTEYKQGIEDLRGGEIY